MATTFKLKRKTFATAVMVGNEIKNAANNADNALSNRSQSYYDEIFGGANAKKSTKDLVKEGSKSRVGRFEPTRTVGGVETYKNTPKVASGKQAFQMGQKSVGVKQGMINTWNRMGKVGKAGTIAGGAVAAGLMAKGLFGGRKKD